MTAVAARSFLSLAAVLGTTEFKLRYAGSVFGYFWSVSKPLMFFGVLYFVFDQMLRFGGSTENYALLLLLGIVLWYFFSETTSASVSVLVAKADLLRKVSFPHIALPVSIGFTALIAMVLNLGAVFAFVLASGLQPSMSWLWLLPLLLELYVLALGVSLVLSALFVHFRDVGQLWDVGLQLLFYATPILYPLAIVPERFQTMLMLSPLAQIIYQAREALMPGSVDPLSSVLDGALLLVPYSIVGAMLIVGLLPHRRVGPHVTELL